MPLEACIIGVGNRWREDDGAGLVIVEKLRALITRAIANFYNIEERLFELQSCFNCYKKLVIIDALPPGTEPGKIKIQRLNGTGMIICNAYSLHDLDLLWQIQYAFLNGFQGELMLIGIEGGSMECVEGLSSQLLKALPVVISKVEQEVFSFLKDV